MHLVQLMAHSRLYNGHQMKEDLFFSGYYDCYCFIINNTRKFAMLHSGFLGYNNDGGCYNMMPWAGPGMELPLPADCWLLGDSGFRCQHPVLALYSRNQAGPSPHDYNVINKIIKHYWVYVEHLIGHLKYYHILHAVYRHPRWAQNNLAEVCAGLAQQCLCLFGNVWNVKE